MIFTKFGNTKGINQPHIHWVSEALCPG